MNTLLPWLLSASALVYLARLVFFMMGQRRGNQMRPSNPAVALPRVSVVVPARNEEQNIAACAASLLASDYPHDKLEILIVDDRSSDTTGALIDSIAQQNPCVDALHRSEQDAVDNLRGKPGALQYGIERATGEIILLTDADCRVQPHWIRTMTEPFRDERVGMVCSFTTVRRGNLFALLQDIEWLYTSSMAQSANANRQPLGCFGNNMAVRTSAFHAIGGYRAISFSVTEDLALLQAMGRRGLRVGFICDPTSRVETQPCLTLTEYLRQKQRWVQGGLGLGWRGHTFALTSVFYWFGLVCSVVLGHWPWITLFLCLRMLGDGWLIANSAIRLRRYYLLGAIAPTIVLLLLLELLLPFLALQKRVVWKGQTFR
ncbi:MAG: glycosyltransferase [Candidatus Kapaibacterium sp.]